MIILLLMMPLSAKSLRRKAHICTALNDNCISNKQMHMHTFTALGVRRKQAAVPLPHCVLSACNCTKSRARAATPWRAPFTSRRTRDSSPAPHPSEFSHAPVLADPITRCTHDAQSHPGVDPMTPATRRGGEHHPRHLHNSPPADDPRGCCADGRIHRPATSCHGEGLMAVAATMAPRLGHTPRCRQARPDQPRPARPHAHTNCWTR